ncbi:N-6 DNA methylase [Anabaena sp. FACHB-1237]|uniref:N-6 DNA methylase n=1 Tax=Anabaena sp. FACHB-1237 TaxID=2692769 RepID=UPI001680039A|nr:N-6 DNA methylase [Anabaena sp. FACHB-1237]MBD2136960.1 N-6 DNA methylase [Anabaena sp. FACHB-1237]
MTHQQLPNNWEEREKLRNKGQFWTPEWVAKAMVLYTAKDTSLIFDPAAGRGAFFDAILKINPSINYYGIDIDKKVLQDVIYQRNDCLVEIRDFLINPPHQNFKAIVANPPYIRHHRIDAKIKEFLQELFIKITGFKIDGRAGYHIYFFVQALNLLDNYGKLAFIMPADTCEGIFSQKLWDWITKNYCLECVVTFDENATPFPNVDTNAMVFFIKKSAPIKNIKWIKVNQSNSDELLNFVESDFQNEDYQNYSTLEIKNRELKEALSTGLSRPKQHHCDFKYHLHDFATVTRGIATGANDFFFLTKKQVEELQIPPEFLKLAIGRTKDVKGDKITMDDISILQEKNRPTILLCVDNNNIPESVANYLKKGENSGLPNRPLIKQRKCWYRMEYRKVPPILFAYLGRRNSRFIKNEAGVVPLTSFLCVYPIFSDEIYIMNLWQALNDPDTIENLKLVGKSYGSGAIKVEPRNLNRVPIPEHIVEKYNLNLHQKPQKCTNKIQQLALF